MNGRLCHHRQLHTGRALQACTSAAATVGADGSCALSGLPSCSAACTAAHAFDQPPGKCTAQAAPRMQRQGDYEQQEVVGGGA